MARVPTGSVTVSVRAQEMGNVSVGEPGQRTGRLVGVVGPVHTAEVSAAGGAPTGLRDRQALIELLVGVGLVVMVAAAGAFFARRPGAVPLDRWVLRIVPAGDDGWFKPVTWLRYPPVIVVGSVVAAAAVFHRDRVRAVACLIGPPLTLVTCELVVKPAVGRTIGGVYSYPSGSTAGIAALSVVAVLAAASRWRTATVVVVTLLSLWMWTAVVFLHWHYPSDALAGLAYGVGVVLVVDGAAWMVAVRSGGPVSPPPAPVTDRSEGTEPPAPPG